MVICTQIYFLFPGTAAFPGNFFFECMSFRPALRCIIQSAEPQSSGNQTNIFQEEVKVHCNFYCNVQRNGCRGGSDANEELYPMTVSFSNIASFQANSNQLNISF